MKKNYILILVLLISGSLGLYAEGTKQVNVDGNGGYLSHPISLVINLNVGGVPYGSVYDCPPEQRVNFRIRNSNEHVFFGFQLYQNPNAFVRIKNAAGQVVWPSTSSSDGEAIPKSGSATNTTGRCDKNSAIEGPDWDGTNSNGYEPFVFMPQDTGLYWFEWSGKIDQPTTGKLTIDWWDISIIDIVVGVERTGRLYSQDWTMSTGSFTKKFLAPMFVYTADQTVSSFKSLDYSPYGFKLYCNSTGPGSSGDVAEDRKSQEGYEGNAEYPIFLNDPDSLIWPTGAPSTVVPTQPDIEGCLGDYCVWVEFTEPGQGTVILDLNGVAGYQPGTEDIILEQKVEAGQNCFQWDGKDGLGNTVNGSANIIVIAEVVTGITHFPTYDLECNPGGFVVERIRPPSQNNATPELFWDDSNLQDSYNGYVNPQKQEFNGCQPNTNLGCHTWPGCESGGYGNELTINTWWYTFKDDSQFSNVNIISNIGNTQLNGTDVTCFGANDGQIELILDGGIPPYFIQSSDGTSVTTSDTFFVAQNLAPGAYTITVTDNGGCINQNGVTINEPNEIDIRLSALDLDCNGDTDGEVFSSIGGGTSPYSYLWSTGDVGTSLSNVGAGTYSLTITDDNQCVQVAQYILNEPPILGVSISGVAESCLGASDGLVTATPSGGTPPYQYQWSTGGEQGTEFGLSAGTYSVVLTDANGCSVQDSFTLDAGPQLNLLSTEVDPSAIGASDGSITITISGGTPDFQIFLNGSLEVTQTDSVYTFTNLSAGGYDVLIIDDNGCQAIGDFTLNDPACNLVMIEITQDVSCFGGNDGVADLNVLGGTQPYNYNWGDGGPNTGFRDNLAAGNYKCTVSDAAGCGPYVRTFTIQQPIGLSSFSIGSNPFCVGESQGTGQVLVLGGTPPYSYLWSNGATTNLNRGLSAGSYRVTITDDNGCTAVDGVTLTDPVALTASVDAVDVDCFGESTGSLTVSVSGGTPPYSYIWTNGSDSATTGLVGSGNYNVVITDFFGCTVAAAGTVNQPATALGGSINLDQPIFCAGERTAIITASGSGGTPPYTYQWSFGPSTATWTDRGPGLYRVFIIDANGCRVSRQIVVEPPASSVEVRIFAYDVLCSGEDNGIAVAASEGGTPPYSFQWSNGSNFVGVVGLAPGQYFVTSTDGNGCTAVDSVIISEPSSLTPTLLDVQNVTINGVSDGSVDLDVSGGTPEYEYIWSNGATTQDLDSLAAGSYTCTITDQNNCEATITAVIVQPDQLLITVTGTNLLCFESNDGTAQVTASGGVSPYTYTWSTGSNASNLTNLPAGTYTVEVRDQNGATAQGSIVITQPNDLLINVDQVVNASIAGGSDGAITISISGGTTPYTILWSNGANTETISGLTAGFYLVDVTDANGCTARKVIQVTDPAVLVLGGTITDVSCNGADDGVLNASVSGGIPPYVYTWSDGSTDNPRSNLSPGVYGITITDQGTASVQYTAIITEPAPLDIFGSVTDASQNMNNGAIDVTIFGGTTPYSVVWSDQGAGLDRVNLAPGFYTISVTDANNCFESETFEVEGNIPPVAVNDTVSTAEGTPVVISARDNDFDVDFVLDLGYIEIITPPVHGTAVHGTASSVQALGLIVYNPDPLFNGVDSVRYAIRDLGQPLPQLYDTAWVYINVTPVNNEVEARTDFASTQNFDPVTVLPLLNDSDPDGDSIWIEGLVDQPQFGTATFNAGEDSVVYQANAYYNQYDYFRYYITDGATRDTAYIIVVNNWTVIPPTANPDFDTTLINEPVTLNIATNDNGNGEPLDLNSIAILSNFINGVGVLSPGTGDLTYTPNNGFIGNDTLRYQICNASGTVLCDDSYVVITVIAGSIDAVASTFCEKNAVYVDFTVTPLNFASVGPVTAVWKDTLGATIETQTGLMLNDQLLWPGTVLDGNGVAIDWPGYIYNGNDWELGSDGFETVRTKAVVTFYLVDSVALTIDYLVSQNPTCTTVPPGGITAVNDTTVTAENTPVTLNILLNDIPGTTPLNPNSISILTQPINGALTTTGTANITYSPNSGYNGIDSLKYRVCDQSNPALCDDAWVYITVTPVNDPPVAVNDTGRANVNTTIHLDPLANDFDPDGFVVPSTFAIITQPYWPANVSFDPTTSTFTYPPFVDFVGVDSLQYSICDNGNPDPSLCTTAWIYVYFADVNLPPVAVNDSAYTLVDVPVPFDMLGNDSDPNGALDPSTLQITSNPTNGTASFDATANAWIYTPNPGYVGTDVLSYRICDDGIPSPVLCDQAQVYFFIDPLNIPPVAVNDSATTLADTPVDITILSNDFDVDGIIVVDSTSVITAPLNGSATINASGVLTYQPNPLFVGIDSLEYRICDDGNPGPSLCDTAWVYIQIDAIPIPPAPPLAINDTSFTQPNVAVTNAVLGNDLAGTDGIDTASVSILTNGLNGVGAVNMDGSITYTPNSGFTGVDSLRYEICDTVGTPLCDDAYYFIFIQQPNLPPVAVNDTAMLDCSMGATAIIPNLANDYDPDGNLVASSVTILVPPSAGSVTVLPNGTLDYTPTACFVGVDSLQYSVCDNGLPTECASAWVYVYCADETPPMAVCNDLTLYLDANGEISVAASAIGGGSSDACGPVTIAVSDTSFTCSDLNGATSTVTVTDASGNQSQCTANITVLDTISPVIDCPNDTILYANPNGTAAFTPPTPMGTDNCTITNYQVVGPGTFLPIGNNDFTYIATDQSGNTGDCSYVVTVIDTFASTLNCPGNITRPTDPGVCGATVATIPVPTISNSNGNDSLYRVDSTGLMDGDVFPVGTTTIIWVVEDEFGNTDTCSYTVTVNDVESPVITGPGPVALTNDPGLCGATYNGITPEYNDNCQDSTGAVVTLISGPAPGTFLPVGTHSVVYQVCDLAGNCATRTYTITITDIEPPTIVVPNDTIITADPLDCSALYSYPFPTGTDNCAVTVTQTGGLNSGSTFPVGTTTNTFLAVDPSGNSVTGQFTVTVISSFDIDLGPDITVCGPTQILPPTGNKWDYQWSTGDQFPIIDITQSGCYSLTVTNGGGCVASDTICVTVVTPSDSVDLSAVPFVVCKNNGTVTIDLGVPASDVVITGPGMTGNVLDPSGVPAGSRRYEYVYTDPVTGCVATGSFVILIDFCSGLPEGEMNVFELYPNPTSDYVQIEFTPAQESDIEIAVLNLMGQELYRTVEASDKGSDSQTWRLQVSEWAAGTYIIQIVRDGKMAQQRFVIQD